MASTSTLVAIATFLAVGGALALAVNLVLPGLWYRFRLRQRKGWAVRNGFQGCDPQALGLDASAFQLFHTRSGKVISCLRRGRLRLVDYLYTQELGGRPADRVDVRQAATGVLVDLGNDGRAVLVRPRLARLPRFLIGKLMSRGSNMSLLLDTLVASIETGDSQFDAAFRVLGGDEASIRGFLTPELRQVMLANRRVSYEFQGREALVHGKLAFGQHLDRLIETGERIRAALALRALD